jgi:Mg2+ and Co2+ transporter CorA
LAYFDEITPHEQGADLYELIGRKMKIKRYVENLDRELSELHQFVSIKEESERNTRLETISRLGAIFLPPTLLASLYGMNIVNFDTESLYGKWTGLLMIFTSAIIGYGLINISHRKLRLILGIAFFAFIIFVMVGLYPQK